MCVICVDLIFNTFYNSETHFFIRYAHVGPVPLIRNAIP